MMDPNANVRERIALLTTCAGLAMTRVESSRYNELQRAYAEWLLSGGFPADTACLEALAALSGA